MRPVNSGKLLVACNWRHGFAPAAVEYQVVPVGMRLLSGQAVVAERHAAIHAARALLLRALDGKRQIDLKPVVDALGHGAPLRPFREGIRENQWSCP